MDSEQKFIKSQVKALNKAAKILGSKYQIAKQLGIPNPNVYQWFKGKKIPYKHVLTLEKLTEGRVKRWELRPDVYPPEEYKDTD